MDLCVIIPLADIIFNNITYNNGNRNIFKFVSEYIIKISESSQNVWDIWEFGP